MNEETAIRKGKKALAIIMAAAAVLFALAAGIGIYNNPANRVKRQMD